MSRVSIDVTEEQHKQLKATAALAGKSIKEYVLDKTLPYNNDEKAAMRELEYFLKPRIEQAERGEFSKKNFNDIKREAYANLNKNNEAFQTHTIR